STNSSSECLASLKMMGMEERIAAATAFGDELLKKKCILSKETLYKLKDLAKENLLAQEFLITTGLDLMKPSSSPLSNEAQAKLLQAIQKSERLDQALINVCHQLCDEGHFQDALTIVELVLSDTKDPDPYLTFQDGSRFPFWEVVT